MSDLKAPARTAVLPGPRKPVEDAAPSAWRPSDLAALRLWLLTRAAVFVTVAAGAWAVTSASHLNSPLSWTQRFHQWDTQLFVTIAQFGYDGDPANPPHVPLDAFFPGLPMLMRRIHDLTGLDHVWAGVLISFLAGGVAAVSLARIAALEAGSETFRARLAERTVLLFLLAPPAIFLAAAYTEALFLAFALPAWLAAKRGDWARAGLLAAGASCVRITGVFLAIALIVEFLTARDGRRRWSAAPTLLLPFLPVLAFVAFLYRRTGDWMRWQHAQEEGWYRVFSWPWDGLRHAWGAVTSDQYTTDWAIAFLVEIAFVGIGLALLVWLLRERRWAEFTFVGLQVVALSTSYWWMSVPRSALTWWPLWIALAAWSLRRPTVLHLWLVIAAPLMIAFTLAFSTGRWAG